MLKVALRILIIIAITACNDKEVQTLGDSFTDNTSVTSIVESVEPTISSGNEAFLRGDFSSALQYYETGLRENRSVAYYNMGVSYYMMQNILEAEKNFRLAVEEDPSFDEAVMNLAAVLAEQEKSEEAEKYLETIVNRKKTARVYVDMANVSLKNGSTAKAAYYYEKAIDIDDESPFVISNYANFLVSMGRLDEGEEILNRLDYKDFAILYNLAYISWMKNNAAVAYEYARQAGARADGSEEGYNKLAALFATMKRYPDEAQTLRSLIMWNPKKEYRLRLVMSYLRAWNLTMADDESRQLLKDYPDDIDVIIATYDIRIAMGDITDAGRFIRDENQRIPDDRLLYQLVRHISLYERNTDEARRMIAVTRQSPLLNLARTAYYIRTGALTNAAQSLSRVPEDTLNDYYIYRSFLLFKDKRYGEAETAALKIDEAKPEYFWYHFVLAWNLHKPERILELTSGYREDYIIASRVPIMTYSLLPVREDMTFSFDFSGSGADIASHLLYPFFIEPDEIYPFLALGYRMLRENEQQAALVQLEKSIEYSNAVRLNNEGVMNLLNYDYAAALENFSKVEELLSLDPFLQYNIGLAHFLGGDYTVAYDRFTQAVQLNRYLVPAHVGRGLAISKLDKPDEAQQHFEAALTNASEYMQMEHQEIVLPMIAKGKYLAFLALNLPDRVIADVALEPVQDNYTAAMAASAKYMISQNPAELDVLRASGIYRSFETAYLLSLLQEPLQSLREQPMPDRNSVMGAKYITMMRTRAFNEEFLAPYMRDSSVLTELVNMAVLSNDRARGLRYLQTLSRLDLRYSPQYKSSFYYFMWTKEFVNAEASYMTLSNLGYYDQDTHYYMMLYFLLNYNKDRLANQIEDYVAQYPDEYRGRLMKAMQNLQDQNLNEFLSNMTSLLTDEPYLFNKMPLEIDIERF